MFYQFYELQQAALQPVRAYADALKNICSDPNNPLANTSIARAIAASAELLERSTRRYEKPEFGITWTLVDGKEVAVREEVVWEKPFCRLLHFVRDLPKKRKPDQKVLLVAPMSGHFATLLRGTVKDLLPWADIYITDWTDARKVPLSEGTFDLNDYVDYVIEMLGAIGPGAAVIAVCQPSVPVLAAVSLMSKHGHPALPSSMVLMGGPVDTRRNPTAVNRFAEERDLDWFKNHVIMPVPWPNPGYQRMVYPGFLQLSGFMGMNLDRHLFAHQEFFKHLVRGDGEPAEKHREFYDEYLAVMDLTAEFYLQTIEHVFLNKSLAKGEFMHRDELVEPAAITKVALMTVEGEKDDISGVGQTQAAHDLCVNLPDSLRAHHVQPHVGHYGVFNGSRFRADIAPRIIAFINEHGKRSQSSPGKVETAFPSRTATKQSL